MAKVLGVGGVFFKARDPAGLARWYEQTLGFDIDSTYGGTSFAPERMPPRAVTVWAPFPAATDYFAPSPAPFMINFVVDDVHEALRQVEEAGGTRAGEVLEESYGLFGWFIDPEGNKVELWEPRDGGLR